MKLKKINTGFSLIELLVVIGIMSILTTIVYVSINATRSKSRDQQRIATVLKIKLGLEYYYNLRGQYPQTLSGLYSGSTPLPQTSPGRIFAGDLLAPNGDDTHGYFYVALTRGASTSVCNSYHLYTKLESNTSVSADSKAGYDSRNDSVYSVCVGSADNRIIASSSSLIYDVRPQ